MVEDLSFSVAAGKTLALVGESGSGKSLTALSIMGLLPKDAQISGNILLSVPDEQIALLRLEKRQWQFVRGRRAGLVFQEPMSALNPLMTVGSQLAEAIRQHQNISGKLARQQATEWFRKVQLPEPEKLYDRYPHQLSGGQKQRVIIAIALCNRPALVIADEPTTALDATVQLEVIRLLQSLQAETGTALLFITHDLALAREMADEVLVLYREKPWNTARQKKSSGSRRIPIHRLCCNAAPVRETKAGGCPRWLIFYREFRKIPRSWH